MTLKEKRAFFESAVKNPFKLKKGQHKDLHGNSEFVDPYEIDAWLSQSVWNNSLYEQYVEVGSDAAFEGFYIFDNM